MRRLGGRVFLFVILSFADGQYYIRMPPYITKGPRQSSIFRVDDAVTLECKGEGVPTVVYEWRKNGAALNLNVDNIKRGIDGTITIQPATSADEGYYQCFVRNQFGTALSVTSHLQRAFLGSTAWTPTVTNLTVKEGDPFHIQATTSRSFPTATYTWDMVYAVWDRDTVPITPSQRVQIADNGDLYFAYAVTKDELQNQLYKSFTYNQYMDVKVGGSYTRVTVTRVPGGAANFAPTLGFSSEPQIVGIVSGSVNIRCFFNGKPEPTIFWNRPGNILPRDRHRLYNQNTELSISQITASDEGNYTCTASNSAGRASHTLQLSIGTEPSFKTTDDRPHNANVREGDTVTFNCKADAKPKADVVWFRNGEKITDAPSRYVLSSDKKSLTIVNICLNCPDRDTGTDIAVIQCNASNIHGYAFASGYLNVFEKTQFEVEGENCVTVDIDNGTVEVELKCSVKCNLTTPVKWTWFRQQLYNNTSKDEKLEERLQTNIPINEGSLKIRIDVDNTTVPTLLEAWRKHFGTYICVADNGIKNGSRTIELKRLIPMATSTSYTTAKVEVCERETQLLNCGGNDVIYIDSARHGRMSIGRCISSSIPLNCSADVTLYLEHKCAGQRQCSVGIDNTLDNSPHGCHQDLKTHLEIVFSCIPVESPRIKCHDSPYFIHPKERSGYLARMATIETGIGSSFCPWVIEVKSGQTLALTLMDFGLWRLVNQSGDERSMCQTYMRVKDRINSESPVMVCGGTQIEDRKRESFYTSNTSSVQLIVNSTIDDQFVVKYEVVGCPDLSPTPSDSSVERNGSRLTIRCNEEKGGRGTKGGNRGEVEGGELGSIVLTCVDGNWTGPDLINCSTVFNNKNPSEDGSWFGANQERYREWLTVSIAVAVTFIASCLLFFLFARLRRRRLQRNNLENETDSRRRSAGKKDSTIPVYDTIQYDDYSTIDDYFTRPTDDPSPNVVAIQSTYLTTTTNAPPCNEFIPSDMGLYEEPVDDAQTGNTASSQHYSETQKTNHYLALYTDMQQSEESANDTLPDDNVSSHHGDEAQTTNEYLCLADRNSGAYLTLYSDLQQCEEQGTEDYTSL